jgi:hypothetical protein
MQPLASAYRFATTKLMHERGHEATVFELLPR